MDAKYLKNIELDKIVEMACERAVCPESQAELRAQVPFTRPDDVRLALAQTDALAAILLRQGNPRLSACQGADKAVSRAQKGGILSMGELLLVAVALRNFSALISWHQSGREAAESALQPVDDLFYTLSDQRALSDDIRNAILSESEMADTASDELYDIRRKIRTAEGSVRTKLDAVIKNSATAKYLQDAVVSIRNGRFVVPVKAEHRAEVGGVIHDVSSSGGTYFVEPTAVVEANAKILQLRSQEQQEIEHILSVFSQRVCDMAPFFEASYGAMLALDQRIAKAELGLSMRGVCPAVREDMHLTLAKARHPLLDPSTAVPVDIDLGGDYDTLVITGPNTGGKTVTLKTAGLLSAMAQLGYLIPAHDSSAVCVFSEILVDIGDEQSIEQSLSTFSGHMRNITDILRSVGPKSLVLLDELGAGTDPAEGAALAVAVIEQLRSTGARVMATTHYAELKMFALDTPGVQNAGSEFDIETLRPTYRLMVGVPGRSNAFLIGEKLGLPAAVIQNAQAHLSTEQRRFESVLTQLEDLKLQTKRQEEEMDALRDEAAHALKSAEKQRDALIAQGQAELDAARLKARTLSDEVEQQAWGLVDEMRQLQKDKRVSEAQKAQRAREIARREATGLAQRAGAAAEQKRDFVPVKSVQVGQEVYLPDMDKIATVAALPDKNGQVEVRIGALKTKLPLAELGVVRGKTAAKKEKNTQGSSSVKTENGRQAGLELNLLGKTVDEALMDTDQFIDDAVMNHIATVYIIHGIGTGALRNAIRQHLRSNRNVKSFRRGQFGEGEDGVTVAELK